MSSLTFLETDSESIYNAVITNLEESVDEPLYPGDERRIFGDALVALFVSICTSVNDVAKQKMLQYARGEVLDALGARYQCTRLEATAAKTTLRFSVNESMEVNIIIPEGTRATPDNSLYFKTIEAAVLQAGSYYVDVPAEAVDAGEAGNDYAVGTISQLVDMIPYIDSVTNTVITNGGDDGEPYPEDDGGAGDDHYRERIELAPTSISAAGSEDSYKYYAKSADASITDVEVISDTEVVKKKLPLYGGCAFLGGRDYLVSTLEVSGAALNTDYTVKYSDELLVITFTGDAASKESVDVQINRDMAGRVLIIPMLSGGELPGEDILKKISEICSADEVRPMTDQVEVRAPETVKYDIAIKYYTTMSDESDCVKTIEGSGGAIDLFKAWQNEKLGRDINPDKLRSLCLAPSSGTGCYRIEIESPSYEQISNTQIAQFSGNLTVSHIVAEE